MWPRAIVVTLSLLAVASVSAGPRLRLNAELGPEVDTNPARTTAESDGYDGAAQTLAPLMRFVGRGGISWRPADNHTIAAGYGGGAKFYLTGEGRPANELVQLGWLSWSAGWEGVSLALAGQYYDAFLEQQAGCVGAGSPCPPPRDFRSGSASLRLGLADGKGNRGSLRAGYHGLQFKPNSAFSFHGGFMGLSVAHGFSKGRGDAHVDWLLAGRYQVEFRRFGGKAQVPIPCGDSDPNLCGTVDGGDRRFDVFHALRLEATYMGPAEASLWYALAINGSRSYGEGYRRHAVGLRFTAPLLWSLFLSVTGVLQFSHFSDPLFARLASEGLADIEVENRSRLVVHLARELGDRWSVGLRYSVYVNESGSTSEGEALPGFLRQTLFLGIRLDYDSAD